MKFVDVLEVTKKAVAQTMGEEYMSESGLLNATESFKIADVGETVLNSENSVEPFTKALVSILAKTVIFTDEFRKTITSLYVDNFEWGGYVQRVYFDLANIIEDGMFNLVNGKSYATEEHTFYEPKVKAKLYGEGKAFAIPISIGRKQLQEAFRSWDELNRFLSGIRMMVENTVRLVLFNYQKMLISCGIACSCSETSLNNAIHLITEAKAQGIVDDTVTDYNSIIALGSEKHRRFLTFVAERIATVRDNMRELTKVYNNGEVPTMADGENNKLLLNSQFAKTIRFNARANTYNSNELAFGDYEEITSWQANEEESKTPFNFETVTSVSIASDSTNKLGIGTSEFTKSGIIGLAFDRRAMGITLEKVNMTSSYTAFADFWNEFTHVLVNYILDTNFSIVAFVLD